MRAKTAAWGIVLSTALAVGCSAPTRHKVLTTLFDGVPPLPAESAEAPTGGTAAVRAGSAAVGSEHGPYAAKMCAACHDPGGMNGLVAPRDQLCFRCHAMNVDRAYVHGPVASGGCLLCHDPHDSRYPALLVSDAETFCQGCHDPEDVAAIDAHHDLDPGTTCTICHDAHGSNNPHLLR